MFTQFYSETLKVYKKPIIFCWKISIISRLLVTLFILPYLKIELYANTEAGIVFFFSIQREMETFLFNRISYQELKISMKCIVILIFEFSKCFKNIFYDEEKTWIDFTFFMTIQNKST